MLKKNNCLLVILLLNQDLKTQKYNNSNNNNNNNNLINKICIHSKINKKIIIYSEKDRKSFLCNKLLVIQVKLIFTYQLAITTYRKVYLFLNFIIKIEIRKIFKIYIN